jgi:hypothetical protein
MKIIQNLSNCIGNCVNIENIKKLGYGIVGASAFASISSHLPNIVSHTSRIIEALAAPIITGEAIKNMSTFAFYNVSVTASIADHLFLNASQYALVILGISTTIYCMGKLMGTSNPTPESSGIIAVGKS